jgi:DNA-binding Xre family transcriptional regulator
MAIIINIDVMLAKRKMSVTELWKLFSALSVTLRKMRVN